MNRKGYIRSANRVGTFWARSWVLDREQDFRTDCDYDLHPRDPKILKGILERGLIPYEGSVAFDMGIAERWRRLYDQHVEKGFNNYLRKYIQTESYRGVQS